MGGEITIQTGLKGKYIYKAIRFLVLYFGLPLLLLTFIGIVFFNEEIIDFIKAF